MGGLQKSDIVLLVACHTYFPEKCSLAYRNDSEVLSYQCANILGKLVIADELSFFIHLTAAHIASLQLLIHCN